MTIVLQDLGIFAMAYLDDIIIFSSSVGKQSRYIQMVFGRLRQQQLKLKLSKCKFFTERSTVLGLHHK